MLGNTEIVTLSAPMVSPIAMVPVSVQMHFMDRAVSFVSQNLHSSVLFF